MYSGIRNVQILIALLKAYGIEDVVLSPGGSDIPLIHSLETDSDFKCYSVVDERSAAYYTMGIAQMKQKPVACICTSGTAACNYLPGITEAFYQNVPVLAITADKNPYFQNQLETQKINQMGIFQGVVKYEVELPIVKNEEDAWLCNRLVNEALLELEHHGRGPVHINIPILDQTEIYDCECLPMERKINLVTSVELDEVWRQYAEELKNKKILIVVGQNLVFSEEDYKNLNEFFQRYNCVYAVEHLSNIQCNGCVFTYPITEILGPEALQELKPDLVISIGNNLAAYKLKPFLRRNYKTIKNWLIYETGQVRDAYQCLTEIFECSFSYFFKRILETENYNENIEHSYYDLWSTAQKSIIVPEFTFSNFYVAQELSKRIPEKSILHLAILNSTRTMQFFNLNSNVQVYSNVGALGIDGCFSTFAGQAAVCDTLAYLLIGDLSFFYDMNAASLRSIGKNVRIILVNNGGGSEFHFFMGRKNIPTIDQYICAEHSHSAEGWIKSLGYEYYSASTKEDVCSILDIFSKPSEKPLFLEIFTKMDEDAEKTNEFYDMYRQTKDKWDNSVKQIVKSIVPEKKIKKMKQIVNILKEKE